MDHQVPFRPPEEVFSASAIVHNSLEFYSMRSTGVHS